MDKKTVSDLLKESSKIGRNVYVTPVGRDYNLRITGVRIKKGILQVFILQAYNPGWKTLPSSCPVFVQ